MKCKENLSLLYKNGDGGWEHVMKAINQSEELLNSTLAGDVQKVPDILEQVHNENTSIL